MRADQRSSETRKLLSMLVLRLIKGFGRFSVITFSIRAGSACASSSGREKKCVRTQIVSKFRLVTPAVTDESREAI